MKLHKLNSSGKTRKAKRLGRGFASGKGKTSGKGHKGQKSRSGFNIPHRFEGGQTSLIQKMAKIGGFKSRYPKAEIIKLSLIEKKFNDGEKVTPKDLFDKGLVESKKSKIKVVKDGKFTKKLKYQGLHFSKSVKNILFKTVESKKIID